MRTCRQRPLAWSQIRTVRVLAGGREPRSVCRYGERGHLADVAGEDVQALAGGEVPDSHAVILTGGHGELEQVEVDGVPGWTLAGEHRDATPPAPRDLPAALPRRLRRRGPAPGTAVAAGRKPGPSWSSGRGGDEEVLRGRECGASMAEPGPLDAVVVVDLGVCRMCQVAGIWPSWQPAPVPARPCCRARMGSFSLHSPCLDGLVSWHEDRC